MAKKKKGKLTDKQRMFVKEYLIDFNATRAATKAGYSKRNAVKIASATLSKPLVAVAIQKAIKKRSDRVELTQDEIVKDLQDLRDKARGAEQFAPAVRCDELLGKHLGMFKERVEHSGKLDLGNNPMALAAAVLNVKVEKSGKEEPSEKLEGVEETG